MTVLTERTYPAGLQAGRTAPGADLLDPAGLDALGFLIGRLATESGEDTDAVDRTDVVAQMLALALLAPRSAR